MISVWTSGNFLERFWAKIDRAGPDECWPWRASGVRGRGRIWIDGRMVLAPRVAKAISDRAWTSDEFAACHSCDSPACCNPGHIWWGTAADNTRDASAKGRLRGPSPHSHCKRGHPLNDETRLTGVNRGCRICKRERFTAWQRKYREGRSPASPVGAADAPEGDTL